MRSSSSARCVTPASMAAHSAGSMSSGSSSSDHGRLATPGVAEDVVRDAVEPDALRHLADAAVQVLGRARPRPAGGGSAWAKRCQAGRSAPAASRSSSHTPGSAGSARPASVCAAAHSGATAGSKGSGLCVGTWRQRVRGGAGRS